MKQVNPRFNAHANRIIRIFDDAINTLGTDYTDSALQEIWSKIAISHHKRNISKTSYNVSRLKEDYFQKINLFQIYIGTQRNYFRNTGRSL